MGRYDTNRSANPAERVLGALLLGLVGLNLLVGLVLGAKWLWQYFLG